MGFATTRTLLLPAPVTTPPPAHWTDHKVHHSHAQTHNNYSQTNSKAHSQTYPQANYSQPGCRLHLRWGETALPRRLPQVLPVPEGRRLQPLSRRSLHLQEVGL